MDSTALRLVALGLALGGCRPAVVIPNTPEAMQCVRECMAIYNQCIGGKSDPGTVLGCDGQRRDCHLTCPGAHEELPEKKPTEDEDEKAKPAKRSCDGSCGED